MALALITAARKLRPYFQAHTIEVYINYPLKLILQRPELTGRLTKWAVELSEFNIKYTLKEAFKEQAVLDFVAEYTELNIEVLDEYQARDECMIAYLDIAKKLFRWFKEYKITQIPREENEKADALSKLASAITCIRSKTIPVAHLTKPSTVEPEEIKVAKIQPYPNDWTTQLRKYLEENILLEDTLEAKRIRYRSTRYTILDGDLYKKRFSKTLQRCFTGEEADQILKDVHSSVCGNHTKGKSLAHKIFKQGFYWPTLFVEAQRFAENCETCQRIANDIRQPPEPLRSLTSPWPFAMWGLDHIGPMLTGIK
ncbi:hypothetical protein LWI29_000919 [Acer saccharum]|uniref:Integrase zinc-binding domain-containing protein n=1 Tax=Acer saccharum TaxID=4024 RepID=A0AA39VMS8_ACESA|nr:hypothetical protein LWI29_000919 [Acer saccharum]